MPLSANITPGRWQRSDRSNHKFVISRGRDLTILRYGSAFYCYYAPTVNAVTRKGKEEGTTMCYYPMYLMLNLGHVQALILAHLLARAFERRKCICLGTELRYRHLCASSSLPGIRCCSSTLVSVPKLTGRKASLGPNR